MAPRNILPLWRYEHWCGLSKRICFLSTHLVSLLEIFILRHSWLGLSTHAAGSQPQLGMIPTRIVTKRTSDRNSGVQPQYRLPFECLLVEKNLQSVTLLINRF